MYKKLGCFHSILSTIKKLKKLKKKKTLTTLFRYKRELRSQDKRVPQSGETQRLYLENHKSLGRNLSSNSVETRGWKPTL
jgi:hypothetical protein